MNEEEKNLIISLAKSRTLDQCQKRLDEVREINLSWSECLHCRCFEFVCFTFLDRNVRRHGKVTSDGVENLNGAIVDKRSHPTAHVIEGIAQCQQDKFAERKGLAEK